MTYKMAGTKNYSNMQQPDVPTKNADDTLVTAPESTARPRASNSQGFRLSYYS